MAKRKKPQADSLKNRFHSTINQSSHFRAEDNRGRKTRTGDSVRVRHSINRSDFEAMSPEQARRQGAYYKTHVEMNVAPGTPGPAVPEMQERAPRVSQQDVNLARRADRERTWRTQPNIYRVPSGERKSPGGFISGEASKAHKQWIESEMKNPSSEFNKGLETSGRAKTGRYTQGQRQRLQRYTDALQQGASHEEALQRVRTTRLKEHVGRPAERRVSTRQTQARQVVSRQRQSRGRETRYQSVAPRANEFTFGIDAQHPPKMDAIKRAFPNASEQELLQIQQAGTENVSQELLANQKWAHETRRANLLGQKSGKTKEEPDKVTIFTTNAGSPAVSVPSQSLVGQYIIRKRKAVLGGFGVPSSQLRGQFPAAVRDAHIVDLATGANVGVQGRSGVFNTTGYRVGNKASAGYGKPKPLGAQILYDSAGRPLYDSQGNIRYSEGATRPIDWSTPSLGFRILMG